MCVSTLHRKKIASKWYFIWRIGFGGGIPVEIGKARC